MLLIRLQGAISMEKMKYLNNLIEMPVIMAFFVLGVVAVLYGIIATLLKPKYSKGIWFAGIGTVVTVTMLLLVSGFNNTAYYPSSYDLQSSLTIQNSSSSEFTLSVMAVVSLLVSFCIWLTFFMLGELWRKTT